MAVALPFPSRARPFVVDDLLRVEQFTQVLADPTGRWLVIERRNAAGMAPRFDLETHKGLTLGRLLVVDVDAPAAARPLVSTEPDVGYVALAFSPDGRSLAVARLCGREWELGVVAMSTGSVRWLGLTPGLVGDGRAIQWLSSTVLTAIIHRPGDRPTYLRAGWQTKHDLPILWERAARGTAVTVTTVGSGRFSQVTPRAPAVDLVTIDLDRGTTRVVTSGAIADFEGTSGGRLAVLLAGETIPPTAAPLGVGSPTRRLRLILVDADGSHLVPVCPTCDLASSLLRWAPSGRDLLVFARHDGGDWATGRLLTVDGASGRLTPLGTGRIEPIISGPPDFAPVVHAGWAGETVVAYARPVRVPPTTRADWFTLTSATTTNLTAGLSSASLPLAAATSDGIVVRDGDQLVRVTPTGATHILMHAPSLHLAGGVAPDDGLRGQLNPRSDRADLVGWAPTKDGLSVIHPDQAASTLQLGGDEASVVAALHGRAETVVEQVDAHGAARLVLASPGQPPLILATINRHLLAVEPARTVPLVHAARDGRPLTSWLYLPAQHHDGQHYPLVVVPYPGQEFGSRPPRDQRPNAPLDSISAQVLAGAGYAVLLPSLPDTGGAGPTAAGLTETVTAIVDRLAPRDDIDLSRVALWGHSFGAYAAATIASQTNRFASVVASGGLYDLVSAYGTFLPSRRLHAEDGLSVTTMAGWSETGQPRLGASPWAVPNTYIANSPLFAVARITAPVLLLQGDTDIAALGQAEELFSALFRQNKDAELATYWGEGHVVASPANLRDLYARVFTWLDTTLDRRPNATVTATTSAAATTR